MNITTLISYIVKYVDDDIIGSLICFIFNKEQIYNPYETYKELFLHFIIFPNYNFGKNCISEDDYYRDREKFYTGFTQEYDENDEDCIETNIHTYLSNVFKDIENGYFKFNNKKFNIDLDINFETAIHYPDLLLDLYNEIFINYCSEKFDENNIFYRYLYNIKESLNSFKIRNSLLCSKEFLNKVIIDIVKNKRIYIFGRKYTTEAKRKCTKCYYVPLDNTISIEKQLRNTEQFEYLITEKVDTVYKNKKMQQVKSIQFSTVDIEEKIKNYTIIISDNDENTEHSLLGAKTINSYINSVKSLDTALNKLNEKFKNMDSCHICNPTKRNTPKDKSHMCKKCDKLVKAIQKNNLKQTQVVYAIKRKNKGIENCKNADDIRLLHYKNLTHFLIKFNNSNKVKNKKEIEGLVSSIFKDFGEFKF